MNSRLVVGITVAITVALMVCLAGPAYAHHSEATQMINKLVPDMIDGKIKLVPDMIDGKIKGLKDQINTEADNIRKETNKQIDGIKQDVANQTLKQNEKLDAMSKRLDKLEIQVETILTILRKETGGK